MLTPPARSTRKRLPLRSTHAGASTAAAAMPAASAASASSPYSAAGGGLAPPGSSHGFGLGQREQASSGAGSGRSAAGVGAAAPGTAGARFDESDFDLEPLISRQDELGSRSEWDDVLAAVSLPHQANDERLARAESPDEGRD